LSHAPAPWEQLLFQPVISDALENCPLSKHIPSCAEPHARCMQASAEGAWLLDSGAQREHRRPTQALCPGHVSRVPLNRSHAERASPDLVALTVPFGEAEGNFPSVPAPHTWLIICSLHLRTPRSGVTAVPDTFTSGTQRRTCGVRAWHPHRTHQPGRGGPRPSVHK